MRFKKLPGWQCIHPGFFRKTITLIFILLLLLIPIFPYLIITDGESNEILFKTSVANNNSFSLYYIHSIHLTPVEEFYFISDDLGLILQSVSFDTYSVGMPSDLQGEETLELKDGKIIISNMNRTFPYLDLRVGQVIANHTLKFEGFKIDLAKISSPGAYVRIEATRLSILELLGVL